MKVQYWIHLIVSHRGFPCKIYPPFFLRPRYIGDHAIYPRTLLVATSRGYVLRLLLMEDRIDQSLEYARKSFDPLRPIDPVIIIFVVVVMDHSASSPLR